jgi:hypothetical protein
MPHSALHAEVRLELHEVWPVAVLEGEACAQVALQLRAQGLEQRCINLLLVGDVLRAELLLGLLCIINSKQQQQQQQQASEGSYGLTTRHMSSVLSSFWPPLHHQGQGSNSTDFR